MASNHNYDTKTRGNKKTDLDEISTKEISTKKASPVLSLSDTIMNKLKSPTSVKNMLASSLVQIQALSSTPMKKEETALVPVAEKDRDISSLIQMMKDLAVDVKASNEAVLQLSSEVKMLKQQQISNQSAKAASAGDDDDSSSDESARSTKADGILERQDRKLSGKVAALKGNYAVESVGDSSLERHPLVDECKLGVVYGQLVRGAEAGVTFALVVDIVNKARSDQGWGFLTANGVMFLDLPRTNDNIVGITKPSISQLTSSELNNQLLICRLYNPDNNKEIVQLERDAGPLRRPVTIKGLMNYLHEQERCLSSTDNILRTRPGSKLCNLKRSVVLTAFERLRAAVEKLSKRMLGSNADESLSSNKIVATACIISFVVATVSQALLSEDLELLYKGFDSHYGDVGKPQTDPEMNTEEEQVALLKSSMLYLGIQCPTCGLWGMSSLFCFSSVCGHYNKIKLISSSETETKTKAVDAAVNQEAMKKYHEWKDEKLSTWKGTGPVKSSDTALKVYVAEMKAKNAKFEFPARAFESSVRDAVARAKGVGKYDNPYLLALREQHLIKLAHNNAERDVGFEVSRKRDDGGRAATIASWLLEGAAGPSGEGHAEAF